MPLPLEPTAGAFFAGLLVVAMSFIMRVVLGEDDYVLRQMRKVGSWCMAVALVLTLAFMAANTH